MNIADQPAFPVRIREGSYKEGMTLRQYYAGLAMQALLSAHDVEGNWTGNSNVCADTAVQYADALITALSNTK